MEEWKDIGYLKYQVSTLGGIRNLNYNKTGCTILLKMVNIRGYCTVKICGKNMRVHRLVAIAFIKSVDGKNIVNHKNGIKHDNRVENLEWCTTKENIQHAYDNGFMKNNIERMREVNKMRNKTREI